MIEQLEPDSWERLRAVRLRALADAPDAFGTTLAEDEIRPLGDWRRRLANPDSVTFLASHVDADIGLVVGCRWDGGTGDEAGLFAMWVAPEARRGGVAGRLVDAVIGWAREHGYRQLLLDVADANLSATALYQSRGFVPTGERGTMPAPREHIPEHRRCLRL